jgi:hypothetical protein
MGKMLGLLLPCAYQTSRLASKLGVRERAKIQRGLRRERLCGTRDQLRAEQQEQRG